MINRTSRITTTPHYLVGLLQAVAVSAYIILFIIFAAIFAPQFHPASELLIPIILLTAFVTSALICGSLILAYPAWLALRGRVKDAITLVMWSIAWLVVILLTTITLAVVYKI